MILYHLTCDHAGCRRCSAEVEQKEHAREVARSEGWQTLATGQGDVLDLCPEHRRVVESPPPLHNTGL